MSSKYIENVKFLFGDEKSNNKYSSLHLLRTDIKSLGNEKNKYYFPRSICLMVVIDLLAKMHFGDKISNSKSRFIKFVDEFIPINNMVHNLTSGNILYKFRCSLHHSFNMSSGEKINDLENCNFKLTNNDSIKAIYLIQGNTITINYTYLEISINSLIDIYKNYAEKATDEEYRDRFNKMFEKYGVMCIG